MKICMAAGMLCLILLAGCTKPKDDVALRARFLNSFIEKHNTPAAPIYISNDPQNNGSHMDKLKALGFTEKALSAKDTVNFKALYKGKRVVLDKSELPQFQVAGKGWPDFRKKHPEGYYYFSPPVLNNDHTMIIISYGYLCGDRCGEGGMELYKKTERGWELEKVLSHWIA